jgi:hypothetical protein
MKPIAIHAGACGISKTTGWVIPRIKASLLNGKRVLLVLPGKTISKNILAYFNSSTTLMINGDTEGKVVDTIKKQLNDRGYNLIIITHDAFKKCRFKRSTKRSWCVWADEVFDTYNSVQYNPYVGKGSPNNWSSLVTLGSQVDGSYYEVGTGRLSDGWSLQVKDLKQMSDPNWSTYTTLAEYNKFTSGVGLAEFAQKMDPEIFLGWEEVNIAAAAFEKTRMCKWMQNEGLKYEVIHPFEKATLYGNVYTTNYFNTLTMQRNSREVQRVYQKELRDLLGEKQTLVLRNVSAIDKETKGPIITTNQYETIVEHNMHGLNGYNHYTAASFETAQNPSPMFSRWLKDTQNFTDEEILASGTTYLAYQFIWRTAARQNNNTPIDVGIMCCKVMDSLFENYIDSTNVNIEILDNVVCLKDKAKEEKKLRQESEAEAKRLLKNARERERYAEKTGKVITEKKAPMTVAERVAKSRAKKKAEAEQVLVIEPVVEVVSVELPEILPEMSLAEKIRLCNPAGVEEVTERDAALAKLRARKSEITMKPRMVPI